MKILLEMVENDQAYSDTLMHISSSWDKVNSISLYSKNMFPTENYQSLTLVAKARIQSLKTSNSKKEC
jgi:hypothetical protein